MAFRRALSINLLPRTILEFVYTTIYWYIYIYIGNREKTTLSSRQACFVIAHSKGDFNDKNIHNHRLYTWRLHCCCYIDGLAISNVAPRDTENIKKEICRVFNQNWLRITIDANKQIINFLDVTFNLNNSTYQPFTKPNTTLQYVHRESNHPPITTKNIPAGINRRLLSLSLDKASFDQATPLYQKALDQSGYHYTLHYEPTATAKRRNRQRNNILWCNPPFSKNVNTNIGHRFLTLVDKHFPKENKLRKIFNRNTIKISYSCMNNTKQIIDNHNKRILNSSKHTDKSTDNSVLKNHATADKRTHTLLTETAFNRQLSTKQPSNVMTITLLKHTSDSQKTPSKQDTATTLHHSVTQNTGTLRNSADMSGPLKTTTLTILFHGVSFHLAHPTTVQVKDVTFASKRNF